MARKRDVFDFFKDNQHRLNEKPSAHSWRRLDRRLDAHRHRNRITRYRVLGMVAGILFLAVIVGLISLSLGRQQSQLLAANNQAVPTGLEDLTVTDADRDGLRTVLAVQRAQEHRRQPISEGAPGQKLVSAGNSAQRQQSSATLEAFSWMAGRWQSREQGQLSFEEWRRTGENELTGRAGLDDKEQSLESMRLYRKGNKIYYSTDFGGNTTVHYTLTAINGKVALFENLKAGFPQQVFFQRQGPAHLSVVYQNAEAQLPETERIRNLKLRHSIRSMQAVRELSKVSLQ